MKIASELGRKPDDFAASNGWYRNWRRTYNISTRKISGEAKDVDLSVVEAWKQNVPRMIENYAADEIWNFDECGLFFRALPDHTQALKGAECKGGKLAKERLTVLFGCSSTGEKFKLLIIGKSANPRCFKGVKMSSLPAIYSSNRRA